MIENQLSYQLNVKHVLNTYWQTVTFFDRLEDGNATLLTKVTFSFFFFPQKTVRKQYSSFTW